MRILMFIVLLMSGVAFGQDGDWCGAHQKLNEGLQSNIHLVNAINALNNKKVEAEFGKITIPVVVHIIYGDSSEIPSLEDINEQIAGLNRDFNGEAWLLEENTSEDFSKLVGDFRMKFKLATTDPEGNETTGITYTETELDEFSMDFEEAKFDVLGGKNSWNTDKYLNIWVCDLEWGLRGYAQFPGDLAKTDGVVVDYTDFGVADSVMTEDSVMHAQHWTVLTHEVGHWMGLYHIWGDNICGDDEIDDTPQQMTPHYMCYDEEYSCGSYDLTVNFMDYVPYDCMVMFTKGQKKRAMRAMKLFRGDIVKYGRKLTR